MYLFDMVKNLFDSEDVYIGYSMDEVSKIINILNDNNIKYTHKEVRESKTSDRFSLERIGVNRNFEIQYTITVKQSDCEEAKYLVNKVLHP